MPANITKIEPSAETTDDIRVQLAALKSDIGALTSTLATYVGEQKRALTDSTDAGIRAVANAGRAGAIKTRAKAEEALHSAEDMVRENPVTSVAISAGVGFLLGLMMQRR